MLSFGYRRAYYVVIIICGLRKELDLDSESVRQFLLTRFGLRIEPEMGKYLADLLSGSKKPVAVIGGDARTGAAVRRMIAPVDVLGASLQQGSA